MASKTLNGIEKHYLNKDLEVWNTPTHLANPSDSKVAPFASNFDQPDGSACK